MIDIAGIKQAAAGRWPEILQNLGGCRAELLDGKLFVWDGSQIVPLLPGSPGVQQEIICVVQADRGQEMLTPDEFAKKHHWTNQPKKVL